jgi:PAS domain S-box-containing protein
MNSTLQAAATVAVTPFDPDPRSLYFFTPLHDQGGQLVDLQLYPSANAGEPPVKLTDWLLNPADATLSALWTTLAGGKGCSVSPLLLSDPSAALVVTPLSGGFLVERRALAMPIPSAAEPAPAANPLPARISQPGYDAELLQTVVTNTSVGLVVFRPCWQEGQIHDFVHILSNPTNAKMTGYSLDDIVGRSIKTIFPGGVESGLFDRLVEVAQTGIAQQYQQYTRHDGVDLWGQFSLCRIGDDILFTVMDISPLKEVQELLNEKNGELEKSVSDRSRQIRDLSALQNAIFQKAGQAIFYVSQEGAIQTVNQASEQLLGYTEEEITGLFGQMMPGTGNNALPVISFSAERPTHSTTSRARFALEDTGYLKAECLITAKDGRLIPVLLAVSVLLDEQQNTLGFVAIASDISALKTAESLLLQKNRELTTFFDGALDMHCISDSQGTISEANSAFQRVLGYTADELRAIPFLFLIHVDEQPAVYHQLLKNILRQPVRNQLNRMRRKDGTYRIIEWNAIAINEVVYGSARDITERQVAERQLRSLNQRLQLATQAAGQGVWDYTLKNNQFNWDDYVWKLHGLLPEKPECSLGEFLNLVHPEDRDVFLATIQAQIESDKSYISNTYRTVHPNGDVRYIETNGRIVRNPRGIPVRLIGVSWDVTERKLAEETIVESERRFREIAENVDEVFWVHAARPFRLLYVNPAYERIWKASRSRLYERPRSFLESIVDEDQRAVLTFLSQYRAGQEGQINCRVKTPEGVPRWLSIRTFIIRDEAGQVLRHIGIANDITGLKEKELILQQALHREQHLNQLKSQFVSTASHEFRTPLTTIQSSVDLIRQYLSLPPDTARLAIQKHLGVIEKEIEQFTGLLTDILTIGSIESGKVRYNPGWNDIVSISQTVIATHFARRADLRRVRFQVDGVARPVFVDPKLMSHVLVNLLSNAFKFSTTDPPVLTIMFSSQGVELLVADTGIGIPANELPTLFQAFFRASNTTGIQGTGLGLVIARQFVELHGGQLRLESQVGRGTTFAVRLPMEPQGGVSSAVDKGLVSSTA